MGARVQASSEAEERREPESNASDAGTTTSDDLLPFLDAEQDNLFLFPEEWHGDASRLSMELKVRQSKRQVFGRCGAGGFAFKVDNVDEVLRQAHADLKKSDSLEYTLVKRNPDGKSARVATEDDVKDLSSLLSSKAKVNHGASSSGKASASPSAAAHKHHHQACGSSSPERARKPGSQYKPGGPCDHCGVTESPQWRRGPPQKPQLCNACGTRFRRTNNLGSTTCGGHGGGSLPGTHRKRGDQVIRRHKADKKPRMDKSGLMVSVSA